ncbi:MAG: ORF6N domain-containing protein [Clostridia bacterium]|nr:ORF6N domain-containing protein [Clostridia bacterium]
MMDNMVISTQLDADGEIAIIDERTIRDKIYIVRGVKVMLDFEVAEIFGYTTRAFNQKVRNNAARFDEDFRFQLTYEEVTELSRSKYLTTMQAGKKGSRTSLPWAFTESGVYMLMIVLQDDLAVQQSKTLIRIFRAMNDCIAENQGLLIQHDVMLLSKQALDIQQTVRAIQAQLVEHEDRLNTVFTQMSDTVRKSEISPFLLELAKKEDE